MFGRREPRTATSKASSGYQVTSLRRLLNELNEDVGQRVSCVLEIKSLDFVFNVLASHIRRGSGSPSARF